jgi:hypothetical protein
VIPRYALLPSGEPCATSYFYRDLEATLSYGLVSRLHGVERP